MDFGTGAGQQSAGIKRADSGQILRTGKLPGGQMNPGQGGVGKGHRIW